jgi:hypothetical protein
MRKRITILFLLFISSANGILAQNSGSDVCFVGLMAYSGKSKKPEEQEFVLVRRLGTFEPVVGEEERTTRAFPIPGSKLFAVASVFYTDESLYVEGHYDSISLQVSISTRTKFDPINSLHNAEAEVMYSKPYAARVYTPFKINGRPKLIVLECRRETKN